MVWRVAVMIAMAVLLGAGAVFCVVESSTLFDAGNRIYENVAQSQPTEAQQAAATRFFQAGSALQLLTTPLAVGGLLAVVGVLMVLAIRWQRLRGPAL